MDERSNEESGPAGEEPTEFRSNAGQSVIEFLEQRTGESPRVTLRDEDSASVSSPIIDPSSAEKSAVPQGRGTYQLMGEIARGGMGVIMKGHDTDLGRDVAVKVLDKRLSERPEVVQRFVEEAQIGGQLQHPGIVPVYEIGLMADERPFFTMKLVKGRTLAMMLTERETPMADRRHFIDVFESICQTMAYAHSRGVIHRDLKPANIMVGAFGEVQVVDWGLAKVLTRGGTADEKRAREAHSNMTILETVRSDGSGSGSDSMVGSILGTPAYMPPEQASGLVDRLDERSDVFALGAILCEILTGLPPYVGERSEIIAAAAQAEYEEAIARLDDSNADPALVKLTKQCLMAAPAARPANASVVAERMHEHIVTIEERAHASQVEAAEARVRVAEEQKARKLTLALGGLVATIVILALGGWSYVQSERAETERVEAARLAEDALRASKLTSDVNEVLAEAALFKSSEEWSNAVLAGERAKALAEGGGAGSALMARIDGALVELRGGQAAKISKELELEDTKRLLDELNGESEPDLLSLQEDLYASAEREVARLEETFLSHGIDFVNADEESIAQELMGRGLGAEIALVLDRLASQLQVNHKPDRAERVLSIAHRVDPDPFRADLRAAFSKGDVDVLKWIVEQGLESQPPGTIELLGNSLRGLGEEDLAYTVYRKGVDLFPNDFSLQFRLGRSLIPAGGATGERLVISEGMGCLQAALALNPDSDIARYFLARALQKLDMHQQSLMHLLVLEERSPGEKRVEFHIAMELLSLERFAESAQRFEQLVNENTANWIQGFSQGYLGVAYFGLGNLESAAHYLEKGIRSWGRDRQDWQDAILDIYLADSEDFIAAAKRIEEQFPDHSLLLNNAAWDLMVAQPAPASYELAARMAQRSVDLENAPASWNTLGVALYYLGKPVEAVHPLEESIRLGGWNIYDSLVLSMVHLDLGNYDLAEAEFDRALEELRVNPALDLDALRFREQARLKFGR